MTRTTAALIAVLAFACGVAAGGETVHWFLMNWVVYNAETRAVVDAQVHVHLLKELESGRIDSAIAVLQNDLDGDVISLAGHAQESTRKDAVNTMLRRIAAYRAVSPHASVEPEVAKLVAEQLAKVSSLPISKDDGASH